MRTATGPRIVVGFGRSGTTWVQDVLAQSNQLRAVFEPLHPIMLRSFDPGMAGYREAGDDDPQLRAYLEKYLLGDFHSLWVDYRVMQRRLVPRGEDQWSLRGLRSVAMSHRLAARNIRRYWRQRGHEQRIVKFVRANMMLSWLQRSFDARIVYIVRHPAAVVLSQLRAARFWHPRRTIEQYRQDKRLLETLDKPTATMVCEPLEYIEACALQWCIEVRTALNQARDSGITVVFYEELIEHGRPEWQRILRALGLHSIPEDDLVMMPSQQAWGDKAKNAGLVRRYESWMQQGDKDVIARVQNVLDATSTDLYRVSEYLPLNADRYRNGPGEATTS